MHDVNHFKEDNNMKKMIAILLSAVLLLTAVIAPLPAEASTQEPGFVAAPQIDWASETSINLVIYPGYEYRINGGSWTASRAFGSLQPDTEYTFQQRNTANGAVSEAVVFKTHHRGPSSAVNNEQLLRYIDKNGTELDGSKGLAYVMQDDLGSDYYFVLAEENEKAAFGLIYDGAAQTNLAFSIYYELDLTQKDINVEYEFLLVSENTVLDQATGSKFVSRNAYNPDYDFQIRTGGAYLTGSDVNELVGLGFGMLMEFWDAEIYAALGFGFKGLGFPYYWDGQGEAICDLQTTYHTGKTEIRYRRDPNCVADGSYGYHVCTACGQVTYWGGELRPTGVHTYDNSCDPYCNDCGLFRQTAHSYAHDCSVACGICGETRANPPAQHTPDRTGLCTVCGEIDPNVCYLTGSLSSAGDGDTVFTLLQNGQPVKTLTAAGNSYLWEQLQPGEYTLTVGKEGHVTYRTELTITLGENTFDLTLCQPGDVVGIGKLNIGDVASIYAHARGHSILTGYAKDCADVSGDGKINVGDVARAYAKIREK